MYWKRGDLWTTKNSCSSQPILQKQRLMMLKQQWEVDLRGEPQNADFSLRWRCFFFALDVMHVHSITSKYGHRRGLKFLIINNIYGSSCKWLRVKRVVQGIIYRISPTCC